jgi:hypothetical protein
MELSNKLYAVAVATENVEKALRAVQDANDRYKQACTDLGHAKINLARSERHPWFGQQVYRIMGGGTLRTRAEHGVVCFRDVMTPDYGNAHIPVGSYYVLVGETSTRPSAHALTKEWELDLL